MPAWTEEDYVKRAAVIAQQSAVSKKPLNDVCEKMASEEALNPEEIRTLVRLSNVAMFQHMFREKDAAAAPDRHVEFEVADPEIVIGRLHKAAMSPPEAASIMNDKLAYEIPDLMGAKRRGFEYEAVTEKVAQDHEVKPAKKDLVVLTMRKLAEEYNARRLSASYRWESKMAELARVFNKAPGYGPSFLQFEKDAAAELGDNALPELLELRNVLKVKGPRLESAKLAEYHIVDDSPHLPLLKEALDARADYTACEEAVSWVEKNTPTL